MIAFILGFASALAAFVLYSIIDDEFYLIEKLKLLLRKDPKIGDYYAIYYNYINEIDTEAYESLVQIIKVTKNLVEYKIIKEYPKKHKLTVSIGFSHSLPENIMYKDYFYKNYIQYKGNDKKINFNKELSNFLKD